MHIINLHRHSLARGNVLVLGSLLAAVLMSDFPHNRATMLLLLPTFVAIIGIAETVRCMRLRWGYYHAGVILCIYMDLMVLCMILFFLIYPYGHFLSGTK
jgi:bacteriorhodopsin